jgi:hypothetical protein
MASAGSEQLSSILAYKTHSHSSLRVGMAGGEVKFMPYATHIHDCCITLSLSTREECVTTMGFLVRFRT